MDPIRAKYEGQLEEICARLTRGDAPWQSPTARLGPPCLAGAGDALRGLPAVLAWHAGEAQSPPALVWRLVPAEELEAADALVLCLPAHGGEALYVARPHRRPTQLVDLAHGLPAQDTTRAALAARLERILIALDRAAPRLDRDRTLVVQLARAFLRPPEVTADDLPSGPLRSKDTDRNKRPNNEGFEASPRQGVKRTHIDQCSKGEGGGDAPLGPVRLARVAAWARVLAEDTLLELAGAGWRLRRPGRWRTPARDGAGSAEVLPRLARDPWLQGCLPGELRVPTPAGQRHRLPLQPLRPDSLQTKQLRRAPALGALGRRSGPLARVWPEQAAPTLLRAAGYRPHAALGLALAQELGLRTLPGEPGQAWRAAGRRLRQELQAGRPPPAGLSRLPEQPDSGARGLWHSMQAHHRRACWIHPRSGLTVGELARGARWDEAALEGLLQELGYPDLQACRSMPVGQLPVVRVAQTRRVRGRGGRVESDVITGICSELGCAESWQDVGAAAGAMAWERRRHAKLDGGIRWIDIPPPPLMAALKQVGDLLLAVAPLQGTATAFFPGATPALHARAHTGAQAAVKADITDFFGSVRPHHVEPWLGLVPRGGQGLLPGWSRPGRRTLLELIFRRFRRRAPYLPQGAPTSPQAANLAAVWLDRAVVRACRLRFGAGRFCYTRYADDMVLSTMDPKLAPDFIGQARLLLEEAVAQQGWAVNPGKTRTWTRAGKRPLEICGLRLPERRAGGLQLDRATQRRARAALHRLRHRVDYGADARTSPDRAHGLMAYAYSATGDLRWLAYTSARLTCLARALAGTLFCESLLAGWADP